MKIIVYYPESKQDKDELQNRIAHVHAETVEQYLKQLSCPKEQKSALITDVQKSIRNKYT